MKRSEVNVGLTDLLLGISKKTSSACGEDELEK